MQQWRNAMLELSRDEGHRPRLPHGNLSLGISNRSARVQKVADALRDGPKDRSAIARIVGTSEVASHTWIRDAIADGCIEILVKPKQGRPTVYTIAKETT